MIDEDPVGDANGDLNPDDEGGYATIDGDNSNPAPANGYARVDQSGPHCGNLANED